MVTCELNPYEMLHNLHIPMTSGLRVAIASASRRLDLKSAPHRASGSRSDRDPENPVDLS